MKFILGTLFITSLTFQQAVGQGCVAIKQVSSVGLGSSSSSFLKKNDIQVGLNFRHFKSFRHFAGTTENPDRVVSGTEVINWSSALDFNIAYGLKNYWYITSSIPFSYTDRSSLYEHGRNSRRISTSKGLGDVRLGLSKWIFDPQKSKKYNLSVGMGFKLPTGNWNYKDSFYNVGPGGTAELRPVDQSIQLGDGGLGVYMEIQGYYQISHRASIYLQAYYMVNPRDTNKTRTYRETLSSTLRNEAHNSVSDQYVLRAGLNYSISQRYHIAGFGGMRVEGIPVYDFIGKSNGFRRPGYVVTVEPGLSWMTGKSSFLLSVPYAVKRDRKQSVTDKEVQAATGKPRNGDAAFADYLINFSFIYKIESKSKNVITLPKK